MKKKKLLLYFFLTAFLIKHIGAEEKNILVIHSYHQGLEWTDNISKGINNIFSEKYDYNLFVEYLDFKRNYTQAYQEQFKKLYEVKLKDIRYDGIITSDNAALEFVLDNRQIFDKDIPKVFCGVNNPNRYVHALDSNEYIVEEGADHLGTLKTIDLLFPKVDTVLIINDNTLTGTAVLEEVKDILPQLNNRFEFQFFSSFTKDSINKTLSNLSEKHAIYLLVLNNDINGQFISYREAVTQVRNASNVPVFGSWKFYLNKGIIGGKLAVGAQQGRITGRLLVNLLEHPEAAPPRITIIPSRYFFDYEELKKWNVTPSIIPEGSIITNEPPEKHYTNALLVVLLVVGLALLTSVLVLRFKVKNRATLEKQVQQRTLELKDTIAKKDQFFSVLAHDLRSPLGNISTVSKLLTDKKIPLPQSKKDQLLTEMAKLSSDTFALLEDILIWGRLQFQGKMLISKKTIQLNSLLREIEKTYNFENYPRTFLYHDLETFEITTDPFIIKFIARNLVQNAIKFSEKGSTIEIGAHKDATSFKFWVKDEGIGIDDKEIDAIMTKKPVQKTGTEGQKSFGLGLPAVIEYVDHINGTLSIESTPGQGSTFIVTIAL